MSARGQRNMPNELLAIGLFAWLTAAMIGLAGVGTWLGRAMLVVGGVAILLAALASLPAATSAVSTPLGMAGQGSTFHLAPSAL